MKADLLPTFDEMRALEIAARRARSQEVARLFHVGARGLKSLVMRLVAMLVAREISHA